MTSDAECSSLQAAFTQAILATANPSSLDADAVIDTFSRLPFLAGPELFDEVSLVGDVLLTLSQVATRHTDNPADVMTDPDASEALAQMSSSEFLDAVDAVNRFFADNCTEG